MPTPVKLGLAGGPLVVAILIGRFGHKMHLVTYTTMSANLMLREIGIVLFLASVGIEAGEHFVQTVVEGKRSGVCRLRFPDYHHPVADNRYDCPVLLQGQLFHADGN